MNVKTYLCKFILKFAHMKLFKYQLWHLLVLLVLVYVIYTYISYDTTLLEGSLFEIDTKVWFTLAILIPIFHQVYVWFCWRLELIYNKISKTFGEKGFKLYKIGFVFLFASRLISIILLAFSNAETLNLEYLYAWAIAGILCFPSAYLFYSVKKYFGMDRAFGIDHFKPEIFKNEPFIKKGIFKYTSNGMYIFGFFILYIPGFVLLSKAALFVALFNHIYIWAHYYFTELPDIKVIYGTKT